MTNPNIDLQLDYFNKTFLNEDCYYGGMTDKIVNFKIIEDDRIIAYFENGMILNANIIKFNGKYLDDIYYESINKINK